MMTSRDPATRAKTLRRRFAGPFYVPVCDCQALYLYGVSLRSVGMPLEPIGLRLAGVAGVLLGLPFRVVIGYNIRTILLRWSGAATSLTEPNHVGMVTRSASLHAGIHGSEGGTMVLQRKVSISRRELLKTVGVGSLALAGFSPLIHPSRASAQPKTLKILQWSHFVPRYDEWFDKKFTKEWGEKHNTQVVVDHISAGEIRARAAAEVAAQKGHDLFMFLDPPAVYEAQVIEHNEIIQEIERKHGKMVDLAQKTGLPGD